MGKGAAGNSPQRRSCSEGEDTCAFGGFAVLVFLWEGDEPRGACVDGFSARRALDLG